MPGELTLGKPTQTCSLVGLLFLGIVKELCTLKYNQIKVLLIYSESETSYIMHSVVVRKVPVVAKPSTTAICRARIAECISACDVLRYWNDPSASILSSLEPNIGSGMTFKIRTLI